MRESKKFLAELKRRGIPVRDLEDDEWHILMYAHYASLAELVLHNYPKETALKYAHTHWRLFLRQAEKPCWG